jgi:molybdate transport system substrate-binding protein
VQAFIITQHAVDNILARDFSTFILGKEGREIMSRYGFMLPGEVK